MSDHELLKKYAESRDNSAFEKIVMHYTPLVYGTCLRRLRGNSGNAEDAVQAVFLILSEKAGRIGKKKSLYTWLFNTARYVCMHMKREEFRRKTREEKAVSMRELTSDTSDTVTEEVYPHLDTAIDTLPKSQKTAVIMHFFEGKSFQEIASLLCCPKSTVQGRLEAGVAKLKKILEKKKITVSIPALTAFLISQSSKEISASVLHALQKSVVSAVMNQSGINVSIISIAQGGMKMMMWAQLKTAAVYVMIPVILAGLCTPLIINLNGEEPGSIHKGVVRELTVAADPVKPAQEDVNSLVNGNSRFVCSLYEKLSEKKGNLFFSSLSISNAMAMTYSGARGNTAKEMSGTLHFNIAQARLPGTFRSLNRTLLDSAEKHGHELTIANGLCLTGKEAGYHVGKEFKALLKTYYNAELFSGGVDIINSWVSKKTRGKIKKILDNLSINSVCVLLNAVYFKGTWETGFKKERTRIAQFRVSNEKAVKVPLMCRKGEIRIIENKDFQAVSIPYKGETMSMIILLPRETHGLAAFEKRLTSENLDKWCRELAQIHTRTIHLYIPKFRLETGYNLVPPLKKLGIKEAFIESTADFRGMGWDKGELWISQIRHKAFIEVNEEGTEAAGATAVEMVTQSMGPRYPVFRADHPFIFMIRENSTGTLLFIGRMADPEGNEA